jgi:hypothetical protein
MPPSTSEDSRSNTWTTEEMGDLVTAWELAASGSRDGLPSQTLHDAVYKHFVALRGGSTRRNKAALTSKRSALKFSYLFVRDNNGPSFFDLSPERRGEVMKRWKQQNSSVVELTPAMYQGLARIVSKGDDEDPSPAPRRRQEVKTRPTRASAAATSNSMPSSGQEKAVTKKKPPAASRATSNPWSHQEMMLLLQAWAGAAQAVIDNTSDGPMSIVHEMYRRFEAVQEGRNVRNLSGLATRRRVLRQSYSRIVAFDKIQEMNGDAKFTDLPAPARQNAIRSWKNANLLDLSAEMCAELDTVIPLDTRAVALEDMRRAKASSLKAASARGRRAGKPSKKQKVAMLVQESKEVDEDTGSAISSQPPSVADDTEEEKAAIPLMVVHSRTGLDEKPAPPVPTASSVKPKTSAFTRTDDIRTRQTTTSVALGDGGGAMPAAKPSVGAMYRATKAVADASQSQATKEPAEAKPELSATGRHPKPAAKSVEVAAQAPDAQSVAEPLQSVETQARTADEALAPVNAAAVALAEAKTDAVELQKAAPSAPNGPGRWGKRKRNAQPDGPNGHLWANTELDMLIKAWEQAAILVCNSDPAERLSLNREMYRVFVEMQGGSSVRNSTALAARRSSLKLSYAHIRTFNAAQRAKGAPPFHDIPEDTRMSLLKSWKNRSSVDLTKEMFDGLGRILAMDAKLEQVRSLRPPPLPKAKKAVKLVKEPKAATEHFSKTAKWPTEESADLIKACADVMNVPVDEEQSAIERESLIYDRFVARRKEAGDTDAPMRRDLRAMAQQWRYILASYAYIKACNDNRSEPDSPTWFDMSPLQRRAYQQCTNVPLKFVDLDAEMFALVTETSFEGAVAPASPSPVGKTTSDGISLRPRSTRKRTEAFWSSDSESSVVSVSTGSAKHDGTKEPAVAAVKKGNNWPAEELWNLIQAWEDAAGLSKTSKLTSALNATFDQFTKLQQGSANRNRSIHSVRNKMIAMKSSFTNISDFIARRGDSAAWFDMTAAQRLVEIRGWGNKTVMDLGRDMYDALARILHQKTSDAYDKPGKRKLGRAPPARAIGKGHAGQKPEKYIAANWSRAELLLLAEACDELLEGRRSRRYVFEEEKDRFFRRYEELGGTNSLAAAVGLARFVMDSYEFIYFYNLKAADTDCLSWFELALADRDPITTRMSKAYRSFNGLETVDEEVYDLIDGLDAELRAKLGETKKKTYKPPNDAISSRYVDIEAVVERCEFVKRTQPAPKKPAEREEPIELQVPSSDADSSSDEAASADESSASDSSAPASLALVATPVSTAPQPEEDEVVSVPRRDVARRGSGATTPRKRAREEDVGADGGSSTLFMTEMIQRQNRKLEEAVKRFRKDSADARKEHHAFLLQTIQDSFPVDSGTGSFVERVAERQGQTLVELFQRLQQQRDAEKAKDDELMRQLFGRSG